MHVLASHGFAAQQFDRYGIVRGPLNSPEHHVLDLHPRRLHRPEQDHSSTFVRKHRSAGREERVGTYRNDAVMVGAVVLIDDDGVGDVVHDDILEREV